MLTQREIITVKIESTYNTDPTPAGSDAVLVENLKISNEGLRMNERKAVRANLNPLQAVYGGRLATLSFDWIARGSGAAGTPPEADALLRASALAVTNVPSTSDTYAPASSSLESCTIYYYQDGKLSKLTGCVGTFTFASEAGGLLRFSFVMTGHVAVPTDTALVSATYDSTVPQAIVSGAFAVGGYSATINALTFDMGNKIAMPPDMNAADGYGQIQVVERALTGSFDPEAVLVATNDYVGDFVAGTNGALTIGSIGGTGGNIIDIDMPAIYYTDMNDGDRDGIRTHEIPFAALESSGDDEISIVFT